MHRSTLEILACPACRRPFTATVHEECGERISLGFLYCGGCGVTIPIVRGLVLFTEALLHPGLASAGQLRARAQEWFGSDEEFNAWGEEKLARGTLEAYAAFQPFNESTRALEPLLPYVTAHLRDGDFILDTWCRTGWSGEWLAGRFPHNHVVSLWEGNSSVLGYRGFAHWLGDKRRAANLDIILTHPERPLPFADHSFNFLYALDALHRYNLYPFAGECLRVTQRAAPLVFAHQHLSNSEPEPFFQRGCRQLHGRDYRLWLDAVTQDSVRKGWVFSEADLFNGPTPAVLHDTPDTAHYNSLICLLPDVPALELETVADCAVTERYLLSPLFRFSLARSSARVAGEQHAGQVQHLLQRHPLYQQRLPEQPVVLDERSLAVLLLALDGKDRQEVLGALSDDENATVERLASLCRQEILLACPVSAAAHQLQRFHCNQLPAAGDGYQLFWSKLTSSEQPLLMLADGSVFTGVELAQLLRALVAALPELGWQPGNWLSVSADGQPLLLVLALMACGQGINVRLARGSIHPQSVCHVHADGEAFSTEIVPQLALGMDGASDTLMARLMQYAEVQQPFACTDALLEIVLDEVQFRCSLTTLVGACASALSQFDQQVWLCSGGKSLHNLCGLIFAVTTQTPFRML